MSESVVESPATRLLSFIEQQVERMRAACGEAVISGDVEAIHDLRVASRRLDQPLRTLKPWLGNRSTRRFRKRLGALRRAFADARDLDVTMELLTREGTPPPAAGAYLATALAVEREQVWRQALAAAGKMNVASLCDRVLAESAACVREAEQQGETAEKRVTTALGRRVRGLLLHSPLRQARVDLHQTRIAAKKLRYAIELDSRMRNYDATDLLVSLKATQDVLGHWNDELMAAERVAAIASQRSLLASDSTLAAELFETSATCTRIAGRQRDELAPRFESLESALMVFAETRLDGSSRVEDWLQRDDAAR